MMNISPSDDNTVRQVDMIVKGGQSVISVETPRGEKFYLYTTIDFAVKGSSTSISYHAFTGIEITPFIYVVRDVMNERAYDQALQKFINDRTPFKFRISENVSFVTYSPH